MIAELSTHHPGQSKPARRSRTRRRTFQHVAKRDGSRLHSEVDLENDISEYSDVLSNAKMCRLRTAVTVLFGVIAVSCGGDSPSSASLTTPTPTTPTTPTTSAPSTTITGTWAQSATAFPSLAFMSLRQTGSAVTGEFLPTRALGATEIGTITGTVSGSNVMLTMQIQIAVPGTGGASCRWADSWSGQISGDRLTGTFSPQTTQPVCSGAPQATLPPQTFPSGAVNFTRL